MGRYDTVEEFAGAVIQHGPGNDRIYLMKDSAGSSGLAAGLIRKAGECGYSKIFAKVSGERAEEFADCGFVTEAMVPGFYGGSTDASFMAYYPDESRAVEADADRLDEITALAISKARSDCRCGHDKRFVLRSCVPEDAVEMAGIYKEVFPSYPFPIHDSQYLKDTMASHVAYFGVECDGRLIALSSAEMDADACNAEMTDFATLPQWRGNGLALRLLSLMDKDAAGRGIKTACTIARAISPGMNITFAKAGYRFAGRLKNNTNISGRIESMNVWYKPL